MSISDQLFEGELIHLAIPDPERDPEIESKWTHDPEYLHTFDPAPARPQSPDQIRKKYEAAEKDKDKQFYFAIRARADGRLLGFVKLFDLSWNHGNGSILIGLGSPEDRGRGYGSEALRMILRYAFGELNLHRVTAGVLGYNVGALRFFERAGFRVEVRQRQAVHRYGRRWDEVILGLLREEAIFNGAKQWGAAEWEGGRNVQE